MQDKRYVIKAISSVIFSFLFWSYFLTFFRKLISFFSHPVGLNCLIIKSGFICLKNILKYNEFKSDNDSFTFNRNCVYLIHFKVVTILLALYIVVAVGEFHILNASSHMTSSFS